MKKMKYAEPCGPSMDKDYRAEDDARTLTRSQEIREDKARYAKACAKLREQVDSSQKAVALETKVKAGLKGAFPKGEH